MEPYQNMAAPKTPKTRVSRSESMFLLPPPFPRMCVRVCVKRKCVTRLHYPVWSQGGSAFLRRARVTGVCVYQCLNLCYVFFIGASTGGSKVKVSKCETFTHFALAGMPELVPPPPPRAWTSPHLVHATLIDESSCSGADPQDSGVLMFGRTYPDLLM